MVTLFSLRFKRIVLRLCGLVLTVCLPLGILSNSVSGQTLLEQVYNDDADSLSVRLSLAVDPNDSIAKGDQDYTMHFGLLSPDGYKIYPQGSSTTIRNSNCGYVLDEATGIITWEILWHFPLGLLVPAVVDLQLCVIIQNVYGKIIWEGKLGDVFQRSDDGVQNDSRPRISLEPTTLPPFSGGGSNLDLIVKAYNHSLVGLGDFFDLAPRDGSTDTGVKRTFEGPELLSVDETCEVWKRPFHIYRRGSSTVARYWLIVWFGGLGQIYCPFDLDLSGDTLEDILGPELLTSDWCTKAEDPTYLDLYPLWGRDATTNVYANAVIRDDTAIDPRRVFFFVNNEICIEDSFFPIGFGQHFKGDCVEGTFRSNIVITQVFKATGSSA